jgi:predicted AlkP superfamily phosphohydrolase/phosphomutase
MISGFDAPGIGGGGAAVDARGMFPPELHEELLCNVGPHPIDSLVYEVNAGRFDLGVLRSLETIRQKAATTKYLITHKPWDCCMILFGESDGIAHHYWKYCDPNSPLYQDQPAGLGDSILRVYQELDRQAGELLALLPPDTSVLMMSDHGFGGVTDWVVYPNCWLRERGFLRFHGRATQWRARLLEALKLSAVSYLPVGLKNAIYRMGRGRLGGIEARVRFSMIDWSGTEAFFDENPYYPAVWINVKGRQPQGIVEPGRHYQEVRDRLIHDLESWRHPETGEPMVEKAYRREEVYSGPHLAEAPDVVVKWALCGGYSYLFRLSSKSRSRAWIEQVDRNAPHYLESFTGKSGNHREYGIFLAHGAGIRPASKASNPRIIDLAPTVLRLLDVPVPSDMDGRVLEEILTADRTVAAAVPQTQLPADDDGAANGDGSYSAEDEETISKRLKSLGYVE